MGFEDAFRKSEKVPPVHEVASESSEMSSEKLRLRVVRDTVLESDAGGKPLENGRDILKTIEESGVPFSAVQESLRSVYAEDILIAKLAKYIERQFDNRDVLKVQFNRLGIPEDTQKYIASIAAQNAPALAGGINHEFGLTPQGTEETVERVPPVTTPETASSEIAPAPEVPAAESTTAVGGNVSEAVPAAPPEVVSAAAPQAAPEQSPAVAPSERVPDIPVQSTSPEKLQEAVQLLSRENFTPAWSVNALRQSGNDYAALMDTLRDIDAPRQTETVRTLVDVFEKGLVKWIATQDGSSIFGLRSQLMKAQVPLEVQQRLAEDAILLQPNKFRKGSIAQAFELPSPDAQQAA